jgi:hypothetical protein
MTGETLPQQLEKIRIVVHHEDRAMGFSHAVLLLT